MADAYRNLAEMYLELSPDKEGNNAVLSTIEQMQGDIADMKPVFEQTRKFFDS